jgi:phosphoribosylanthranilate isomerase
MNIRVKICGITNLADARIALEAGADYLGFILYPNSPRHISIQDVRQITDALRAEYGDRVPFFVGVFVNESVAAIENKLGQGGLNLAQLSGDESPQVLAALNGRGYKAIRPQKLIYVQEDIRDYAPLGAKAEYHPAILVDTYHPDLHGGTGQLADLNLVAQIRALADRMMLAGGLTPDNIAEIVRTVRPFGVDVASGVEASKGIKDHGKVREFISNARMAAQEISA